MKQIMLTLALTVQIMILLVGCVTEGGKEAQLPVQPSASPQLQSTKLPDRDAVVARIGEHEILYKELADQMAMLEGVYSSAGAQYTEEELKNILHKAALDTLEGLIQNYILDTKIQEYGIELTQEEIEQSNAVWDAIWAEAKERVQREQPNLTGEDLNVMIEANILSKGLDRETVQAMAMRSLKLERLRAEVTKEVLQPTQQELDAEYAKLLSEQKEQFENDVTHFERMMLDNAIVVYVPRDYRVLRQLDLTFDQDVIDMLKQLETYDSIEGETYQDMEKNELRILSEQKIPAILKQLESGTSFVEVMEANKSGSSKRVNYICKDSTRFSQDYYAAAYSLVEVGQVAEAPIQQKYGYSLLSWEDSIPEGVIAPELVYEEISAQMTQQAENELWKDQQARWRSEADVTVYEAVLAY